MYYRRVEGGGYVVRLGHGGGGREHDGVTDLNPWPL